MSDAFLSLLCTHCAPTLSGVKPACIFTLHKENIPGWQTELSSCRSLFSGNGLRLRVLCGCRRHLVIMVYRPALLRESLRQPERRAFLQARGYPVSMGTGRLLDELSRRMRSAKAGGFPHEIGLFLGYPLEDVTGFIAAGGAEYRCSGCWKVYGRRRTGTASVSSIRRLPQTVSGYGVQRADTWRNARRRLNAPLYQF